MTPLSFSMLRILSDCRFHSGEDIAKTLDVSRASICNAAKTLEAAGLEIDRIRGRGYRMSKALEWLDRGKILSLAGSPFEIEICDIIDSTNSELLRANGPHGRIVAAEMQTNGRGRMGRAWHASPGGALTFSISWRFDRGAGFLSGLSLAVGVALVRAMKTCDIEGISLKWPNDMLYSFHKLAGILIEVKGDMLGPTTAVIGIGINFRLSGKVRENIDQAVIDLESIPCRQPGRNALFAAILRELEGALDAFETGGFEAFRQEWTAHHAYHMKPVRMKLPSGKVEEGIVAGVSERGEILLDTARGRLAFSSGEVSLRGAS
ncbi:MAG: biotin--[acetyl-CoA-carboxylase] ligase [Burkholderiales bacterium]|nr:biotin--[acetyl-CoA-carboxylase] ligase [Burkholderiales bacterium]